ncbi:MAG: DUF2103 domain-containing protein [Candidatus Paceibacterota bacterium]
MLTKNKKDKRSGGKYCGSHTTVIDAALIPVDIAHKQPEVYKISLGYIKAGLPSANGDRRVKIVDIDGGVLLSIRGNTTHQEVTVYTHDSHKTKFAIACAVRDAGINISFENRKNL